MAKKNRRMTLITKEMSDYLRSCERNSNTETQKYKFFTNRFDNILKEIHNIDS